MDNALPECGSGLPEHSGRAPREGGSMLPLSDLIRVNLRVTSPKGHMANKQDTVLLSLFICPNDILYFVPNSKFQMIVTEYSRVSGHPNFSGATQLRMHERTSHAMHPCSFLLKAEATPYGRLKICTPTTNPDASLAYVGTPIPPR